MEWVVFGFVSFFVGIPLIGVMMVGAMFADQRLERRR